MFNPLKVNRFRDFYIQPLKTDKRDAFVIANILRYGKVKPTILAPAPVQKLGRLVRYRRYLCDELTRAKNKIRCMLDEVFPEYQNMRFFSDLFGQSSRALLKVTPTPENILSLPPKEWASSLLRHSKRLGWKRTYDKTVLIYQCAKSSIGSKVVAEPLKVCIKDLIYELEPLEERIRFFTGRIEKALSSTKNRMAKRGQTSLAHVFYQIALSSLRYNPHLREYYLRKLSQEKPKKVAVVSVARKLVRIVYSMLKNNKPYDHALVSKSV